MSDKVFLYPSLTEELLQALCYPKMPFSFFFTDRDGFEKELQHEPIDDSSSIYCIKDVTGEWDQDKCDFGVRRDYCLSSFKCLFGPFGIICRNAALGLAVVWTSSDSKQRGVIPVKSFTYNDQKLDASIEKVFGKAQLRGQVDFTTILYIAEAGQPENDERHLANETGFILGELDSFTIRLDGKGSAFPIYEVTEAGQPLWSVNCDWIDPTTDALSECVSLNINKAHKNYKYLDKAQVTFNAQLLAEIMASAITIIIEKLRPSAYWDQIIGNDSLEEGSVGQAVYYFADTLGWDLSSPESVSLSVRKFLDQRM